MVRLNRPWVLSSSFSTWTRSPRLTLARSARSMVRSQVCSSDDGVAVCTTLLTGRLRGLRCSELHLHIRSRCYPFESPEVRPVSHYRHQPATTDRILTMTLSYDPQQALCSLSQTDRRLGAVIEQIGPFGPELFPYRNAFEALTRSIIYQQLAGHAAQAIHARLLATFPRRRHPGPAQILALSDEQLRGYRIIQSKNHSDSGSCEPHEGRQGAFQP